MKKILPTELQTLLGAQPGAPVLDVRTPVEFAEVHAVGARNVPLNTLRPSDLYFSGQLRKGEPVYLLCRTQKRSEQAWDLFEKAGYDDAVVVAGGTLAWEAAGLPVVFGARVISLERQVRIAAGALVLAGALLTHFVSHWFIALPAFVGAGLVFAGVTDFCGMGLLLARLPWNTRVPGGNS